MVGVDVSEHQYAQGADWWRQWQFGIIRVHSGFRDDNRWQQHLEDAREAGVPIELYGYIEGPSQGANPEAAAARLVELARANSVARVWADAEDESCTRDVAIEYTDTLRASGLQVGVYANIGDYARCFDGYADDLPWWMADYGPNDGTRHDPFEQAPVPKREWLIHQYTSLGGPNHSGLDLNLMQAGDEDLNQDQANQLKAIFNLASYLTEGQWPTGVEYHKPQLKQELDNIADAVGAHDGKATDEAAKRARKDALKDAARAVETGGFVNANVRAKLVKLILAL